MLRIRRVICLLITVNLILFACLLFYNSLTTAKDAQAQTCVPFPPPLNWSAMYKVIGPSGGSQHGNRNVSCNGNDVRVACFAIGRDNLELEDVTPFAPNGCTINADDDSQWWPIALCVPQT